MLVTIDVDDVIAQRIIRWASVGRTIDAATSILDRTIHKMDVVEQDDANHAIGELRDIKQMVDSLHHDVREKLWANGVKKTENKKSTHGKD